MAKGDHITVKRMGGVYTHHGIDMGDGTVIHYSGELFNIKDAHVCRVPLEEFCKGEKHTVIKYPPGKARPVKEVIKTAKSFLGERKYNILLRNCEHFAVGCKTGAWKSKQVERVVKTAIAVTATAAVVVITAAGAYASRRRKG